MYDRSSSDGDFANMILQVSAGSSWLVRGAAALILIVHISGAGIGLLSGAAALLFRKGGRLHRIAGNVFFVSMPVSYTHLDVYKRQAFISRRVGGVPVSSMGTA